MNSETDLLIIGAGPFVLAIAVQAAHAGIEHVIAGRPMEFWRKNMPKGMCLRSACDWNLDAQNIHTIERFLETQGKTSRGETVFVDQIIFATGYKVNIAQLSILASGNILDQLKTRNGFPELDDHFQTSVPGLFITSMPATQDFGPFFGFTVAVRAAAQLICEELATT